MKSARILIGLCLAALPIAASANVNISKTLHLPSFDGLSLTGEPSSEVNRHTEKASVTVRLSNAGLKSALERAGLPPRSARTEERHETPQCKATQTVRTFEAQVLVSDRDWLKRQSWTCRMSRKLFGKCVPKSFNDIAEVGVLVSPRGDGSLPVQEKIEALAGPACVSDATTEGDRFADKIGACINAGGALKSETCAETVRSHWTKLERQNDRTGGIVAVETDGGANWTMKLVASSNRWLRQPMAPLVHVNVRKTELVELNVAGAELSAPDSGKEFAGTLGFTGYVAFGTHDAAKGKIELTGTYRTTIDDKNPKDETIKKELDVQFHERKLNNIPASVRLQRGEILGVESYVAADEGEKGKGGQFAAWCANIPDNVTLTTFGRFMCSHGQALVDLLSKHVQTRARFADQDGVERFVTWERTPRGRNCSYEGRTGFSCRIPRDESEWRGWLYGNNEDQLLKQIFSDPSYGPETVVIFDELLGFLPKAAGSEPLQSFVTPQTRSMSVETSDGRKLPAPETFSAEPEGVTVIRAAE